MSHRLGYRWEEDYNALIEKLHKEWGGDLLSFKEIKPLGIVDKKNGVVTDIVESNRYSRLLTKYNGYEIIIDNSRIGFKDRGGGEVLEIEYLVLYVLKELQYNFKIQQKNLKDKLKAFLKIDSSCKTGNEIFDKEYDIGSVDSNYLAFLSSLESQKQIMELEPFDLLKVDETGVLCTQQIEDRKQLETEEVKNRITKLTQFVSLIR